MFQVLYWLFLRKIFGIIVLKLVCVGLHHKCWSTVLAWSHTINVFVTLYSQSSLINNTLVSVHLYFPLHWRRIPHKFYKSLIVICYTYCRKRRKKQKEESLRRHKQKKEQEESRKLKEFYSNSIKVRYLQTQAWLQLSPQVPLHWLEIIQLHLCHIRNHLSVTGQK